MKNANETAARMMRNPSAYALTITTDPARAARSYVQRGGFGKARVLLGDHDGETGTIIVADLPEAARLVRAGYSLDYSTMRVAS